MFPRSSAALLAGTCSALAAQLDQRRGTDAGAPIADASLGLLLMEAGRRLDLRWLLGNPSLLRATAADVLLSFVAIFFRLGAGWPQPGWAAATAAVTMASAPAVVLLTVEESSAQGQVTERVILHTAIATAVSFVLFALVLGFVHAELSADWINAVAHPLWVAAGAALIAWGFGMADAGRCGTPRPPPRRRSSCSSRWRCSRLASRACWRCRCS